MIEPDRRGRGSGKMHTTERREGSFENAKGCLRDRFRLEFR